MVESEKIESPNIKQSTIPLLVVDEFFLALKIKIKSTSLMLLLLVLVLSVLLVQ